MRKTSLLFAMASALALTGCVSTPEPEPNPYDNTLRVIPSDVTNQTVETTQLKDYDTTTSYSTIEEEQKPYIRYIMNKYAFIAHEITPPNEKPAPIDLDSLASHSRNVISNVEQWKEAERIRRYQESLPPPPKQYDPNTYTLPVGFGQNDMYWSQPQQQQYAPQGNNQQQANNGQAMGGNDQVTGNAGSNSYVDKSTILSPKVDDNLLAPQSQQFTSSTAYQNTNNKGAIDSNSRNTGKKVVDLAYVEEEEDAPKRPISEINE